MRIIRLTFDYCWVEVQFSEQEHGYINVSILENKSQYVVSAMMYSLRPNCGVEEIEYYEDFSSVGVMARLEEKIMASYPNIQILNMTCGYLVIIEEGGKLERFLMTFVKSSQKWLLKSLDDAARKCFDSSIKNESIENVFSALYSKLH